ALPAVCGSIEELYTRTDADLVVVTVYADQILPVAMRCLEFPWTVLLEKPPGLNLEESRQILAVAEARGRDVRVGFNRRFYGSTRAALADLDSGGGRRLVNVQSQRTP